MPTPRYWIPDRPTPETRIYRLCYRCGIDIEPKTGQRRQCRDCHDLEKSARKDALIGQVEELWRVGLSQRAIAREVGVAKGTVANWCANLRAESPEVEFEQSIRDYPDWVREIHVDAHRMLQNAS